MQNKKVKQVLILRKGVAIGSHGGLGVVLG
jgi:hypothetical protein